MKKTDWQYLVDTLLFICIGGIAFIGFLMGFFLAQGPTEQESEKIFLGLHRHQWGNIHLYLSIAFSILVIIHLIFNWKWIKAKARKIFKEGWRTALIFTAVASILVAFLFWAFYPKRSAAYRDYGTRPGKRASEARQLKENTTLPEEIVYLEAGKEYLTITGQMTLLDLEKVTGIPTRKNVEELMLPSELSLDETLGRMRKIYPFTLQEVRDIISELLIGEQAHPEKEIGKQKISFHHARAKRRLDSLMKENFREK